MIVRMLKFSIIWLVLSGAVLSAESKGVSLAPPKVHSEASGVLYSQEKIVQKLVAFCIAESPAFKDAGRDVLGNWQLRNANYMSLAPRLWAEARQAAIDAGDAARWQLYESELWPEILNLTADIVVDSVRREPKGVKRESKCTLVFGLINKGGFDIAGSRTDKAVLQYLDSRLGKLQGQAR